jgi:hypothetical protein
MAIASVSVDGHAAAGDLRTDVVDGQSPSKYQRQRLQMR